MGTPLYILSFSNADSIRYFSRASSNDYKKGKRQDRYKSKEKTSNSAYPEPSMKHALKGL